MKLSFLYSHSCVLSSHRFLSEAEGFECSTWRATMTTSEKLMSACQYAHDDNAEECIIHNILL